MDDLKKCDECGTDLMEDVCPSCSVDGDMDDDMDDAGDE